MMLHKEMDGWCIFVISDGNDNDIQGPDKMERAKAVHCYDFLLSFVKLISR